MRKLILPLIVILFVCTTNSFSQAGTTCTNAVPLSFAVPCGMTTPVDISNAAYASGAATSTGGCGYGSSPANGKIVWFSFHPTAMNNRCVKVTLSTNSVTTVRMEVTLYQGTGACTAMTAQPAKSLCFADGSGVWTQGGGASLPAWSNWSATRQYYLRVYIPDAITTAAPGLIPPQVNYCAEESAPANDLCTNAKSIDGSLIGGSNVCAVGGASEPINGGIPDPNGMSKPNPDPSWICAGALQNTVWYKYKVENTGTSSLQISAVNCDGFNGQTIQYLQIGLMVGGCTPATILPAGAAPGYSVVCNTVGPGSPNATTVTLNAPSLPAGSTVLVAMDGYLNANCSYNFFISNAIPVPIKLKYFGGWEEGTYNHMRWITSFEFNNAYFEVQRSVDGLNFESIGRIAGSMNSTQDLVYGYDDTHPPAFAYYRLAQFDLDNRSTYSDVVMIKRHNESAFFNVSFANPVQNSAMLSIATGKAGKINLQVVDVAGRNLSTQAVDCGPGANSVLKDFSRLPAGSYFLIVTQDQNRIVKPFIKQ